MISMMTNCYDVTLKVKCVPGDDHDAICDELADVLIDLDILPYDYDMCMQKVGELL